MDWPGVTLHLRDFAPIRNMKQPDHAGIAAGKRFAVRGKRKCADGGFLERPRGRSAGVKRGDLSDRFARDSIPQDCLEFNRTLPAASLLAKSRWQILRHNLQKSS